MKKPGAVIFDMDGVLVDTEPFHYENENRMFQKLGIDVAHEEHSRFVGVATDWMWHYLVESRNLPYTAAELTEMTIKQGLETLQLLENLPVSPGLVELLEKFCELKMPLALATSSDTETMRFILQKTGLKKYFQIAVCRNDVAKSKPAPDVFLKAALLMNVAPADCLVFEDSRNGIAAAKAAGMLCIAYSGNHGKQDQSAADDFINMYDEVNSTRFHWMVD